MCGRFVLYSSGEAVIETFRLANVPAFLPRYIVGADPVSHLSGHTEREGTSPAQMGSGPVVVSWLAFLPGRRVV